MNILVTGAWIGFDDCKDTLIHLGNKVKFIKWEKDELSIDPEWVEGIICNSFFQYHSIEKFINLRFIQLTSVGYDKIPQEYTETHSITVLNAGHAYSIPMAEYVIGTVLQLYKQFARFRENQNERNWSKIRNLSELYGKNVLIVGCGNIGNECAKRFWAFGCNVYGVNRTIKRNDYYRTIETLDHFDEFLSNSDIILLSLPLTNETKNLMNKVRLAALKQNAIVINISRGEILDYEAFIELKTNKERNDLGGIFDVFHEEPLSISSDLWNLEHVIITPHNSYDGEHNKERLNTIIIDNLKEFVSEKERIC